MFIGQILDGRYEILKEIGRGGMSTVYMAVDVRLHKSWAVKEIRKRDSKGGDSVTVHSFMAEAEMMKKLDHPALPRIVDILDGRDSVCIVLDYVTGEALDRLLLREKRFPESRVMEWFLQLAEVLEYLHTQTPPIIYRDMKPGNIIQTPEGHLKLIDFGIAREYKYTNTTDTVALGTNGYAAPEQYGHAQTDSRSDIYSLGMTIFELLTGISPGKDPYQYKYHPLRKIRPEITESTEKILNRCIAFSPEQRYQSCRELIFDLKHPERMISGVRRQQKMVTALFFLSAALSGIFCTGGFLCSIAADRVDDLNYEKRVSISKALPCEVKIENYLAAIQIDGGDARAYEKMLEAYRENGFFGEKESRTFLEVWSQNRVSWEDEIISNDFGSVAFQAGILYLYLYTGGDGSFRNRVLKAQPFFEDAAESGNTVISGQAENYLSFCAFCIRFAFDSTSVLEPSNEDYRELLEAIDSSIREMDSYRGGDSAYVRLTMYEEFGNLINAYRKGMASTGIEEERAAGVLNELTEEVRTLPVTQEKSVQMQEKLLIRFAEFRSNIERTWKNTQQRKEADRKKDERS
ncbi:MAG: serine/threonine protein kinase [Bilifractor sp.]